MKKALLLILLVLLIVIVFWWLKGANNRTSSQLSSEQQSIAKQSISNNTTDPTLEMIEQESGAIDQVRESAAVPIKMAANAMIPTVFTNENLAIKSAWVKGIIPGANTTAAYFDVSTKRFFEVGGLSSPQFERVEIHEMSEDSNGLMSMKKIDWLNVEPPGISLKPGGKHVMLIGSKQKLNAGDNVTINLEIAGRQGGTITFDLPVVDQ